MVGEFFATVPGFFSPKKTRQPRIFPRPCSSMTCPGVFEMAAFHAANPEGKVRLHPIFLEKVTVIIMLINHLLLPIQVHVELNSFFLPFQARQAYNKLWSLVPVFIYTHWLRKVYREIPGEERSHKFLGEL